MRESHETIIQDKEGNEHVYVMTEHPGREGLRLMQRILSQAAHPFGLVLAAFQKHGSLPEGVDDLLDDKFDAQPLGQALEVLVTNLGDNIDIFQECLRYTRRDNMELSGGFAFDNAYQANYMELFRAVYWVVKCNFGDIFQGASLPFVRGPNAPPESKSESPRSPDKGKRSA